MASSPVTSYHWTTASQTVPIWLAGHLLQNASFWASQSDWLNNGVTIVTTETVLSHLPQPLLALPQSIPQTTLTIPDGEAGKTAEACTTLLGQLADMGHTRDRLLVAVGGGALCDVVGFVAATYHRGVPLLLCPTTLLAQLDASVGGKTAINLPQGKNLVGAFYPPLAVVMDIAAIQLQPAGQRLDAMSEALKMALAFDADYWDWIGLNLPSLAAGDTKALQYLIERSVQLKVLVIERDPFETHSERVLLNLGHTLGHALERAMPQLSHGIAVALGLRFILLVSEALHGLDPSVRERYEDAMQAFGLPVTVPSPIHWETLVPFLKQDKKRTHQRAGWVTLKALGHAVTTGEIPTAVLKSAARAMAISVT